MPFVDEALEAAQSYGMLPSRQRPTSRRCETVMGGTIEWRLLCRLVLLFWGAWPVISLNCCSTLRGGGNLLYQVLLICTAAVLRTAVPAYDATHGILVLWHTTYAAIFICDTRAIKMRPQPEHRPGAWRQTLGTGVGQQAHSCVAGSGGCRHGRS